MLSEEDRKVAAEVIFEASKMRESCVQPSSIWPDVNMDDAYDIQRRWVELCCAEGAKPIGYKIGLTNHASQRAAKVAEPDFGILFKEGVFAAGQTFAKDQFFAPRIEAELAFVMGQDLMGQDLGGEGCTPEMVLAATDYVLPALEIVDYRTEAPRVVTDTIADNAAFGGLVLGETKIEPLADTVRWVSAALSRNSVVEETGVAAAGMGSPAAAVAWLVDRLAQDGKGLKAGDIVLSGAFARPIEVGGGDKICVEFGPHGVIDLSFD